MENLLTFDRIENHTQNFRKKSDLHCIKRAGLENQLQRCEKLNLIHEIYLFLYRRTTFINSIGCISMLGIWKTIFSIRGFAFRFIEPDRISMCVSYFINKLKTRSKQHILKPNKIGNNDTTLCIVTKLFAVESCK